MNKYPTIPNIEKLVIETRDNYSKRRDKQLSELYSKALPYFNDSLVQLQLAKDSGINSCSIKCEDVDIVNELIKQYSEEKYETRYVNNSVIISWPE